MAPPWQAPGLAPWAVTESSSRGRRWPEPPPDYRSEFQRDRDRILHSSAFRRLEYKTQVFVNHEGDLFRTRLTHSLEVSQIARTVARALGLNEDLTEAVALGHDLGHTPFGHAGQDALNACLAEYGGFEHNVQSLRTVDVLEQRYPEFPGLNLTFDTREGLLKRCPRRLAERLGDVARRFTDGGQPSLEAQLTNLADEIAYNSHDVDDGLRAGLITLDQLAEVPLVGELLARVRAGQPHLDTRRTVYQLVRRMIGLQVVDLVETTRQRILDAAPGDVAAVRARSEPLAAFSDGLAERHRALKHFLLHELYRHYRVHRMATKARRVVSDLYQALMSDPRLLPEQQRQAAREREARSGLRGRTRAVADYVAGMTDRFALAEHDRLFHPHTLT